MLYDPKWEMKAKPSLDGLIAWLETQDPTVAYDFDNCQGQCLIGQYMNHLGIGWINNYMPTCRTIFGGDGFSVGVAVEEPWTYGAALFRARALAE